ncbi:unnamed protein product [Chironomus riparius]|uniref:Uncharacterized protein n=1 Tax=Chironomus riparius TaxID=315576 RepID=A0A9P0JCM6_9DIPT|nr:unnamed protein product [Chironomus riparius]
MRNFFQKRTWNLFNIRAPNQVNLQVPTATESQVNDAYIISRDSDSVSTVSNHVEIKELTILNCKDLSSVLDFFNTPSIIDQLKESESVLFIKFLIDEDFGELTGNDITKLADDCAGKSIVILLESMKGHRFSIYWKSREIPFFLAFKPYDETMTMKKREIYDFIADFLTSCLKLGHLGIQRNRIVSQDDNQIELEFLTDTRGYNLLLLAASSGFADIVQILLEMGISPESQEESVKAQELAWDNHHSNVVLTLLQANLPYPKSIDIRLCSDDLRKFMVSTEELHFAIGAKNTERVKEIIGKYPNQRYFYNFANDSALKTAILTKSIDIYELLIMHKLAFAPIEDEEELWDDLKEHERKQIREIHFRNLKDLPEKHINILMAHSFVGHDVQNNQEKREHVQNAYKFLNSNPFLSAILMVVVASKKLRSVFDFNRDSVQFVDPTVNANINGMFYLSGRVYVGAKQLLDKATKYETYSTLAHELCHYAIDLTYNNNAKPYLRNDNQTMQEFEEISKRCQERTGYEEYIDMVYDYYPTQMQHAELIVRVPHLMALYHENPERLKELRHIFPELFDFYEKKVVPEMLSSLPEIERRDEKEIEKKDKKILNLKKILFFSGILSIFAIIFAVILGQWLTTKPNFKFEDMTANDRSRLRDGNVIYKDVEVKFHDLFADNSTAYYKLTSDHITNLLDGHALNFTDTHFLYLNDLVHHDWENLAGNLKQKFLTSNFTFQNESLKFEKLAEISPDVFNFLTSKEIVDVLDGKELAIGNMIENKTDFYVERRFIFEGQEKTLQTELYTNTRDEFVDVIDRTERRKFFILSSEAGAGKTVTFEHLAAVIKRKFPTKWVSYVDLKDHVELYRAHEKLIDVEGLIIDILKLKSKSSFELKIFQEFFRSGNVVLLWNGFDEISPTYEEFVSNLLRNIHSNTQNVQYVCTRPLYSDFLQDLFQMKAYQLVPFTKSEQEEFLSKFFISKNVSGSKENLIGKVMNISLRLDFNTPLMLKMIAEIHDQPKLLESENLFEIYKCFVDQKVKIWQEKSDFAKNLSKSVFTGSSKFDIIAIYQKFSMQLDIDFINVKKLDVMQTKIPDILPFEEISRMGILYVNNETQFAFSHKTFAEFFIAKYFIDSIYDVEGDLKVEEAILRLEVLFYAYKRYAGMTVVAEFMKHYIMAQQKSQVKNFHPVITKLLKTKFKSFLFDFLETRTPIVFDWMLGFFQKDRDLFHYLIQLNEPETLGTASLNPVYRPTTIKFDEMKNISRKYLNDREFQKFTSGRNQRGVILFGLYFFKFFNFSKTHDEYVIPDNPIPQNFFFTLFDTMKDNLTIPEQKELFIALSNPRNYRHFSTFNISSYSSLWTNHGHLLSPPETKDILGDSIFWFTRNFYNAKFTEYENVLHYLIDKIGKTLTDSEIFEIFVNKNLLQKATLHKFTLENLWNFFVNHTTLEQQKDILRHHDSSGKFLFYIKLGYLNQIYDFSKLNILHLTLMYSQRDRRFMNYVLEMYTTRMSETEMQQMILSSNEFLLYAFKYCDKFTFKDYTEYLEKLFDRKEKLLKELLDKNIERTDLNAVEYMKSINAGIPEVIDIFNEMYNRVASKVQS